MKARTKHPDDIPVGPAPVGVAVTPDGKTAFVTHAAGTVSTIDVKTRTLSPTEITVGAGPFFLAVTPNGKEIWVTNRAARLGSCSTRPSGPRTPKQNPRARASSMMRGSAVGGSEIRRLCAFALDAARFVDDAFEEAADGGVLQWTGRRSLDVMQDVFFALGRVDREGQVSFNLADLDGVFRALIEELDQHLIHAVDRFAQADQFGFGIVMAHREKTSCPDGKRFSMCRCRSSAPSRRGAQCPELRKVAVIEVEAARDVH